MSPSHPLALPPPATRIAHVCPNCGGELRVWGIKRPRLCCLDKKGCGWRGPPPTDALLKRQGNQMLPGLEVEDGLAEHADHNDTGLPAGPAPAELGDPSAPGGEPAA